MLLHFVDVDHLVTVRAVANVSMAIGLVEIDSVHWKKLMAVATLLLLLLHLFK